MSKELLDTCCDNKNAFCKIAKKTLERVEVSDADDTGNPMNLQTATLVIIGQFQILFNFKIIKPTCNYTIFSDKKQIISELFSFIADSIIIYTLVW